MILFRFVIVIFSVSVFSAPAGFAQVFDKQNLQSFDSNGTRISYSVQGQGDPVLLIHGWHSSSKINWVLPGTSGLLAKDFQVIAFDVRGHGLSDKPTEEDAYGPELVEDVVRLIDHLKIKKVHVVGYSLGGIIAGNFIVKHPDRVLSGTFGGMGWMKAGSAAQFAFAQIGKNDPNAKAQTVCGRSLAKLALTEAEIKSISVPIIILVGDDDRVIQRLYVEHLKVVRKDWPVKTIADANHFTCILKPQFREEIYSWLKQQSQ